MIPSREGVQGTQTVVLELEPLLDHLLDTVPRIRPALRRDPPEDRHAVDPRASSSFKTAWYTRAERRLRKPRRDNDDRPNAILGKAIFDLECGSESDWLGFPDENSFPRGQPRLAGHDLRNAAGHGIRDARISCALNGNQHLGDEASALKNSGTLEDEVVRVEVFDEDDVAVAEGLGTDEALPDRRHRVHRQQSGRAH